MADGDIFLVSKTGDTINLNPLLTSDNGVQVVSGLTGFGLPSVEVMYQVGAGDGAKFRGQRALPRDIDLPLHIKGTSRANLRTHVNRLVRALSDECTLQWDDGERVWETKVRRVGGGEYIMGTDTNLNELNLTITVRSESPSWTATDTADISSTFGTTDTLTQMTLPTAKFGTMPSRPTFKMSGPTLGFTVMNHDQTAQWSYLAFIADGDYITVDTETGRVLDSKGNNKYANMSTAPSFWDFSPERNTFWIKADRTSASYTSASTSTAATNLITNPTFNANTTGWTLGVKSGHTAANTIVYNSTAKAVEFKDYTATTAYYDPFSWLSTSIPYQALTVGKRYSVQFHLSMYERASKPATLQIYRGTELLETIYAPSDLGATGGVLSGSFIAGGNQNMEFRLIPPMQSQGAPQLPNPNRQMFMQVLQATVVDDGYSYFDGDTPDVVNGATYSWTGTAHASTSTLMFPSDKTKTKVDVNMKAKNWMVV